MKRYIAIIAFISILPYVAFASWWNPFTWFNQSNNSNQQQVQQTQWQEPTNYSQPVSKIFYVQSDNTRVHDCASLSCKTLGYYQANATMTLPYASVDDLPEWISLTIPSQGNVFIKSSTLGENKVVIQKITQTGTQCNGDYYNQCPSGQNLVCPSTGKAYCDTPKTSDQMCIDKYGSYSYFAGQKTCGCKAGYGWNSTQTSCVVVQVKNGYQSCGESFPNETWDGTYNSKGGFSCVCKNGYTWDNAQSMCVSYQQQYLQQAVDKANSSGCQTAKQNLQTKQKELDDFHTSYDSLLSAGFIQGQGGAIQDRASLQLPAYTEAVTFATNEVSFYCGY